MKRFVISILFVSVFCVGLGALVDKVGAKFKSDEKALALIRDARQAIGGEAAITAIKSMTIAGHSTRTFKADGTDRTIQSDTEYALQLPDKMMKMVKSADGEAAGGEKTVFDKRVDVVVVTNSKNGETEAGAGKGEGRSIAVEPGTEHVFIKKDDGTTEVRSAGRAVKIGDPVEGGGMIVRKMGDGNAVFLTKDDKTINEDGDHIILNRVGGEGHHDEMRHNELLRLTLGLLLTAPEGTDVSYTMGGDGNVDGTACNIVNAEFGGTAYRIYLNKSSNLPMMISYNGIKEPQVFTFRTKSPQGGDDVQENMVFTTRTAAPLMQPVEISIKFSDYRSTGGVQLPYKWTQTVAGALDEVFDVTAYEVNPANIGDKFSNQNVKVRMMKKPDGQ